MATCGLNEIVSDTRFWGESALISFVNSLIFSTERGRPKSPTVFDESVITEDISIVESMSPLQEVVMETINALPSVSFPTETWMEMVLVEIALRNRERFHVLWPVLAAHYRSTLRDCVELSYSSER